MLNRRVSWKLSIGIIGISEKIKIIPGKIAIKKLKAILAARLLKSPSKIEIKKNRETKYILAPSKPTNEYFLLHIKSKRTILIFKSRFLFCIAEILLINMTL